MNLICRLIGHKEIFDPIWELSMPPAYNTFTMRCGRCKTVLKRVSQQMEIMPIKRCIK